MSDLAIRRLATTLLQFGPSLAAIRPRTSSLCPVRQIERPPRGGLSHSAIARERSRGRNDFRNDPQLLLAIPAPAPFNRRDHLDRRHRAMPIVTIRTARRAIPARKTG